MRLHTYNLSTQKADAGRLPQAQSHSSLHSECQANQGYKVRQHGEGSGAGRIHLLLPLTIQ